MLFTLACCVESSLKKLAIELVGDWLRLEDGETESAVLPRENVGLRLSGFGLVAPTMELPPAAPLAPAV